MELTVYRSLDRSVQFFGIKGRFLIQMGIGAVTSLITACMIGSATNGLAGIALFLILFFAFAMAVVALQGSISEKALFRKMAMSRCPQYIKVKPQRLIGSWKSTEEELNWNPSSRSPEWMTDTSFPGAAT